MTTFKKLPTVEPTAKTSKGYMGLVYHLKQQTPLAAGFEQLSDSLRALKGGGATGRCACLLELTSGINTKFI